MVGGCVTIKEKGVAIMAIITSTNYPNLSTIINKSSYNIPTGDLAIWEIIFNQRLTQEYLEENKWLLQEDGEEFVLQTLNYLLNNNQLFLTDEMTGEILYQITPDGEEYMVEDLLDLPTTNQEEVVVC